jgi:simple sugar transport system ATP-binding protein
MIDYTNRLINRFDIRSSSGSLSIVRGMSGGNQQKAILAREVSRDPDLLIAVQPTRGLDIGAIEYIHKELIAHRDKGKAVLIVSFELDEVLSISDRILVMYNGEIVVSLDASKTNADELGLYMLGAKRGELNGE